MARSKRNLHYTKKHSQNIKQSLSNSKKTKYSPSKKINVFLDLDETLLSAKSYDEFDINEYKAKAKLFNFHDMDGYYIIFERPGVQDFLDYLFKHYNVSVWTAASKDYALFVVKNIILANKPNRKINYVFFDYHGKHANKRLGGMKNLRMLWEDLHLPGINKNNTILIDDNIRVYKTQPDLVIRAREFDFLKTNSEFDMFLYDLPNTIEDKFDVTYKK